MPQVSRLKAAAIDVDRPLGAFGSGAIHCGKPWGQVTLTKLGGELAERYVLAHEERVQFPLKHISVGQHTSAMMGWNVGCFGRGKSYAGNQ